jgi:4'-phosphopantetheinyl transferase
MTTRLWWVRPETVQASPAALALLNDEERAQHQRYIPPAKRHEYLVTRVLVRTVLGKALGRAPAALRFVRNEWGCPALEPDSYSSPIHFNISHTDGLVVCLVSTEYRVGVDTELLARAPALLGLAPRVFAPAELSDLDALPEDERAQRAVRLWTLKESYIKARGMGLALALDGFAFRFDESGVRLEVSAALDDHGSRWQFQTQALGPHLISAAIGLSGHKTQFENELDTGVVPIAHGEFRWPG